MNRTPFALFLYGLVLVHSVKASPSEPAQFDEPICNPTLKGVVLIGSPSDCKLDLENVSGINLVNFETQVNIGRLDNYLERLYGECITLELVEEVKGCLYRGLRDLGYPFVLIDPIPDEITQGVLQYRVVLGKVGEYTCKGNRWFSDYSILKAMRQDPGTPLSTTVLLDDIAWLNNNPFRNVSAVFSPGREPYTTDIELVAQDRFLLRTYAGGDNTGTVPLGRARFFAGFDWGQAFKFNHILSYQFTSGVSYRTINSHTIHYTAFLPQRHTLIIFGGYTHVHPNLDVGRGGGYNAQGSVRYEVPLYPAFKSEIQQVELGFDVKSMNNNLIYEGERTPFLIKGGQVVNITQLVGGYNLGYESKMQKFNGQVLAFVSPGKVIANQNATNFNAFRVGSSSRYYYGRLNLAYRLTPLDYLEIHSQVRVQWTTRPLVPSEQFAIGGYDTVRGYNEREYNSDRGVCLNLEVRSPCIRYQSKFKDRRVETRIVLLTFLDYGYGNLVQPEPPQASNDTLYSVGAGFRYYFGSSISGRFDYGFKLRQSAFSDDTAMGRFHGGGMFSF